MLNLECSMNKKENKVRKNQVFVTEINPAFGLVNDERERERESKARGSRSALTEKGMAILESILLLQGKGKGLKVSLLFIILIFLLL